MKINFFIFPLVLIIIILAFGACSGNPPKIEQTTVDSFYYIQDQNFFLTHFSITLQVTDPDGIDDVDYFTLRHTGRDVSWTIPLSDVHSGTKGNGTEIVLPLLGYIPFGGFPPVAVPPGNYDLEVVDLAGESDNYQFVPVILRQSDLQKTPVSLRSTMNSLKNAQTVPGTVQLWFFSGSGVGTAVDLSDNDWVSKTQDIPYTRIYLVQKLDLPGVWLYSLLSE